MKPIWMIETTAYDDQNPRKIIQIVERLGMQAIQFNYVPFGNREEVLENRKNLQPVKLPDDSCVVMYSSINAARASQRMFPWVPIGWADWKKLRCQDYYAHWGKFLAHDYWCFMPFMQLRNRWKWLFETFQYKWAHEKGYEHFRDHIFIRPDDNAKSFAGELVAKEKMEDFLKMAEFYGKQDENLCVVAAPVMIRQEWRLIIHNGKVISGSQYKLDRLADIAPGYPKGAADFAEQVAASTEWQPAAIYCMDIGVVDEGWLQPYPDYRLIEIGSANTAGLYDCELQPIVEAMTKQAELDYADSGWNTDR